LHATLIAKCHPYRRRISVIIALSTLALFIAAIVIRRTLLLFVVAHHRGCVVALSMLSCQPSPIFVNPVAGRLLFAFCCHCPCRHCSSATLVAIALAAIAIALFVARHPR
jgi:hypothetical protein